MSDGRLPFEKRSDPLGSFLKMFFAVLLAGLAIYAARAALAYWTFQQVTEASFLMSTLRWALRGES